jgi:hypothetical protein
MDEKRARRGTRRALANTDTDLIAKLCHCGCAKGGVIGKEKPTMKSEWNEQQAILYIIILKYL